MISIVNKLKNPIPKESPSINELTIYCQLKGDQLMGKKKMDEKAARRVQSHTDKTGKNQDFKARAQRAANKNKKIVI